MRGNEGRGEMQMMTSREEKKRPIERSDEERR